MMTMLLIDHRVLLVIKTEAYIESFFFTDVSLKCACKTVLRSTLTYLLSGKRNIPMIVSYDDDTV